MKGRKSTSSAAAGTVPELASAPRGEKPGRHSSVSHSERFHKRTKKMEKRGKRKRAKLSPGVSLPLLQR